VDVAGLAAEAAAVRVNVEWMDGEGRDYPDVKVANVGSDHVLRIYGVGVGGQTPLSAELPVFHIREIKRSER
jgi:hypothetical protein